MPKEEATCNSTCEVANMANDPTQIVTLNTVFRAIGTLEGKVEGLHDKIEDVQEHQTTLGTKLENIKAVADQPHICLHEDDIKELQGIMNKALGGKAMLIFLIMLFLSVAGTIVGAVIQYKGNQQVNQLEQKVEKVTKEVKGISK